MTCTLIKLGFYWLKNLKIKINKVDEIFWPVMEPARFLKCFLNYFLFEKYQIDIFLEDFQWFKYVDIKNIMKKILF